MLTLTLSDGFTTSTGWPRPGTIPLPTPTAPPPVKGQQTYVPPTFTPGPVIPTGPVYQPTPMPPPVITSPPKPYPIPVPTVPSPYPVPPSQLPPSQQPPGTTQPSTTPEAGPVIVTTEQGPTQSDSWPAIFSPELFSWWKPIAIAGGLAIAGGIVLSIFGRRSRD